MKEQYFDSAEELLEAYNNFLKWLDAGPLSNEDKYALLHQWLNNKKIKSNPLIT